MAKIFISYSSKDKEFVTNLANDLKTLNHKVWLDEWEIKIGDNIPKKISTGIEQADYVALILSPNSVESKWVEQEWHSKHWDAINTGERLLLPILIHDCKIPQLLKPYKYADFRTNYAIGLSYLTLSISPTQPTIGHGEAQLASELETSTSDNQDVFQLLEQVYDKSIPLSKTITRCLSFAKTRKLEKLSVFCATELKGWRKIVEANPKIEPPDYRSVEAYLSPFGQVNLNYYEWSANPSNVFDYMATRPKEFFQRKMVIPEPIDDVERFASNYKDGGIYCVNMPAQTFMKKGTTPSSPDATVPVYMRANTYVRVLEAVRNELASYLLEISE